MLTNNGSEDDAIVVERVARYIIDHFQIRTCQRYVKSPSSSQNQDNSTSNDCICGRSQNWHAKRLKSQVLNSALTEDETPVKPWSLQDDTRSARCDSFGQLFFVPGEGLDPSSILPGASANYIRLSGSSNMEDVYRLITSKQLWAVAPPQLIIEVAGTKPSKFVYVDRDVLDRFNAGIISAAQAANAWFVTGGSNTGIMGLVGDAVARSRMTQTESSGITCLGIVPFGVVNHREQLINFENQFGTDEAVDLLTTTPSSDVSNNDSLMQAGGHVAIDLESSSASSVINLAARLKLETQRRQITTAKPSKTCPPVDVLMENWTTCYTVESAELCRDGVALNPGHSAFLLVDNGREKVFGEEVEFRNKFLRYLSQRTLSGISGGGGIVARTPVVLLVVGGAINTLSTVEQAISSKASDYDKNSAILQDVTEGQDDHVATSQFPRPVVLLSGLFWGASDLLSFAYKITAPVSEKDKFNSKHVKPEESQFSSDFDEKIRRHPAFDYLLAGISDTKRKSEESRLISLIRRCLRYRTMITVVNLLEDTSMSLDSAILDAIFKSNFGSPASTFELAQLWNRVDIAKQILRQHGDEVRRHVDNQRALSRALMFGQDGFVKLFTEDGHVDLRAFLTLGQLRNLYREMFLNKRGQAGKSSCIRLFRSLMMRESMEDTLATTSAYDFLENIGDILADLLGCYMDNVFVKEKHVDKLAKSDPEIMLKLLEKPYQTSLRDMFLLQLLLHRTELAKFFFKVGHDHIGTAVMATIFLRRLSKEAERLDMTDLAIAYGDASSGWEHLTIQLLSSCYEQDPVVCSQLLRRRLQTWQDLTVLEMCYFGDRKHIMEQPAVQTALAQTWLGKMASFSRPVLIYACLFPPLTPFLIFKLRFEERSTLNPSQSALKHWKIAAKSSGKVADIVMERGKIVPNSGEMAQLARETTMKPRRMRPFSAIVKQRQDVHLVKAAFIVHDRPGRISIFKAIFLLFSSPIAKHLTHSVTLACFLFLFSFFVLSGIHSAEPEEVEFIIWLCCFIYLLENVRQTFAQSNLTLQERLEDFFLNPWMVADLFGTCLVVIAVILRFTFVSTPDFVYAHTVYAVACVIYWLKSLRIFFVSETMGPKVFTLFKMMGDVKFFVLIYFIMLMSFSTPIYSLLYPDRRINDARVYFSLLIELSYERMWNIFVVTMDNSRAIVEGTCRNVKPNEATTTLASQWNIVSDPKATTTLSPSSYNYGFNPCSQRNIVAIMLYIVFLMLTNISLLNMLIAMFAHTVDKTRSSATRLWRFSIYQFLHEYYFKPILPGPLMIFELTYRFTMALIRKCTGEKTIENCDLSFHVVSTPREESYLGIDDYDYRRLEVFEKNTVESVLQSDPSGINDQYIGTNKIYDSNGRVISKLHNVHDRLHAKIDVLESRMAQAMDKAMLSKQ